MFSYFSLVIKPNNDYVMPHKNRAELIHFQSACNEVLMMLLGLCFKGESSSMEKTSSMTFIEIKAATHQPWAKHETADLSGMWGFHREVECGGETTYTSGLRSNKKLFCKFGTRQIGRGRDENERCDTVCPTPPQCKA